MLLPIYNYHPIHLPPITFLKPSPSLPLFSSQNPIKPYFHRTSIPVLAVSSDTQALPQSAIRRIAEKLRSLGYVEHNNLKEETLEPASNSNTTSSPGQIFVPLPTQLPKHRVGHTLDPSWSTPENPVPAPGSGNTIQRFHELRHEYLKEKEQERLKNKEKKDRAPTLAELTLSAEELKRLRALVIGIRKKIIVGKAGITEGIVNGIHERWRRSELVKIKCEDLCRLNMKRTHDLLERKTGGVVIWRSGSNIILYRGADYKYPYFSDDSSLNDVSQESSSDLCMDSGEHESSSSGMDSGFNASNRDSGTTLIQGVGSPNRVRFQLPGEAELTEEADNLLEGLGPRYTDWWGCDPLPIDADLLPAIVPGYKRPFRLLPYGVYPKLTNDEMTTLKRLGRPLPCHFALGRNRKHQGLAASIVKLWEKCEIAKIAVKRGVQNTNSELMAEELKWLTGGTLLSRDREFIVFYRGKDFLPSAVSSAIEKRRKQVTHRQKRTGLNSSIANAKECEQSMMTHASDDERTSINDQKGVQEEKKLTFMEASIRKTEDRLAIALEKKSRAEKLLVELEKEEISQQPDIDKEGITEEERFMLRKVGLRMKPFLLLGRRGVFDGTVENMHLHWKYRELVKVITGRKSIEEVHQIARTLEAESGGILVAVEQVSKGFAIIMYRGKNYERPASLRPQTLLSKREAMKRSIEAQRRQSLKLHVLKLTQNIEDLKLRLAKKDEVIDIRSQHINDLQQRETGKSDTTSGTNFQSDLASLCSIEDHRDAAIDTEHSSQQELPEDSSFRCENKADCVSDATQPTHQSIMSIDSDSGSKSSRGEGKIHFFETSSAKKPLNVAVSHVDSLKPQAEVSSVQNRSEGKISRTVNLSNRERLLLRKQALKIRKQPVLAVGRSNIVTGVAKAIKEHFKKHPLAIVNIKGRAKGTSVREVVFNLEQATGAVLVSQEPSKVILYRGWGAATARDHARTNGRGIREHRDQAVISPELISAIRFECGLQSNHES